MKDEQKYPIGGYAPGDYQCKCTTCNIIFLGNREAFQCEPCAIKDKEFYDSLTPEGQQRFDNRFVQICKLFDLSVKSQAENSELRDAISSNDTIIDGLQKSVKLKEEENKRLRAALVKIKDALFTNTIKSRMTAIEMKYLLDEALKQQP